MRTILSFPTVPGTWDLPSACPRQNHCLKVVSAILGRNINYPIIIYYLIYCGLVGLVVPFVIVCDLGAQADLQRRVFLTFCLRGGQLADQEDRSDERDQ